MLYYIEICCMTKQTQHKTDTVSGIFVLILGGLVTLSLMLIKYFNVLNIDLEVVLAPFIVSTLLTYGDKIIFYFLAHLLNFATSSQKKLKDSTQSQQQLTDK